MGINEDALLTIRAELASRIDQIAEKIGQIHSGQLADEIDAIRRVARDYGLDALADLSHGLESALGQSNGSITILPFLDLMRDAVGCNALDEGAAAQLLTVANQRLYG